MSKVQDYLEKKRIEAEGLPKMYVVKSTPEGVDNIVERQVINIKRNFGTQTSSDGKKSYDRYELDKTSFPYEIDILEDEGHASDEGHGSGIGDLWGWTYFCSLSEEEAELYRRKERDRVYYKYIQPSYFKDISILDIVNNIYPNTLFQMAEDLEKQVLDTESYLADSQYEKTEKELTEYPLEVAKKKSMIKGILSMHASYTHPGVRSQELCTKYEVKTFDDLRKEGKPFLI